MTNSIRDKLHKLVRCLEINDLPVYSQWAHEAVAELDQLEAVVDKPPSYLVLPASEVAVGHCVILNHSACPYGKLVTVVVSVTPDRVYVRHLCEETGMRVCYTSRVEEVTPVADFGVEVRHNGVHFLCQPVGDSVATYADGASRLWQEPHGPSLWPIRSSALEFARQAVIEQQQADSPEDKSTEMESFLRQAGAGGCEHFPYRYVQQHPDNPEGES